MTRGAWWALTLGLLTLGALSGVACVRAGFDVGGDGSRDLVVARDRAPADSAKDLAPADLDTHDGWLSLEGSGVGSGITGRVANAAQGRFAVGPQGHLYLAWTDDHTGVRQVYVKAWRGKGWEDLAGSAQGHGISATTGLSRLGNVATLPSGHPVVIWFDHGATRRVMLRAFDGVRWNALGDSIGPNGISGNVNPWWPNVTVDPSGRPVAVWEQYWGAPGIRLSRFESGAWGPVASSMKPGLDSDGQLAQVAAHGDELHVLWRAKTPAHHPRYRHFDGTLWSATETPFGSATSTPRSESVLALDSSGGAWLAVVEGDDKASELLLLRRQSAAWGEVARLVLPVGTAKPHNPSLLHTATETFLACRLEDSTGTNIYLFRLNQGSLEALHSPVPGGLSKTARASNYPNLAVAGERLYVSWEQSLEAGSAIYLRYRELGD